MDALSSNTVDKKYIWGLDLAQSLHDYTHGAGGVGGLLSVNDNTERYYTTYDANGNVGQLLTNAGTIVAQYEYSPFGKETVKSGSYADENIFRFSSRFFDTETGLYYYGFRSYSPELGRWITKDPLQEAGGMNLYVFVSNDGINLIDNLGLERYGYAVTGSDTNAFQNRAQQGAGQANTKIFSSGQDLMKKMEKSSDITQADIHSHGWEQGVIGDGEDTGLYKEDYEDRKEGSATARELAEKIAKGNIDVEKDAEINFFGCHCDKLAKELSEELAKRCRGDISVTGSESSVGTDKSSSKHSSGEYTKATGKFNTYKGGKKQGITKNTKSYK